MGYLKYMKIANLVLKIVEFAINEIQIAFPEAFNTKA